MALDKDAQSRLVVDLVVTKQEAYDEVVAFTEKMLNQSMKALFDLYPKMARVLSLKFGVPTIDATIDAPKIIIPTDPSLYGEGHVLYQLNFKSGTIKSAMGLSAASVAGWKLAIPCSLGYTQIDGETGKVADRKEVTVAGRTYAYPGDYSVERLFAQISTASWESPNMDYSLVIDPETGENITFGTFNSKYEELATCVTTALTRWGQINQEEGRSTLNVKFVLPDENLDVNKPTYVPTYVRQQIYPHIGREFLELDGSIHKKIEAAKKAGPRTSGDNYSCLLWCEMVRGNSPPSLPHLSWTGNFVCEPTNGETASDNQGTFALSYKLFLEKHLLPRLRPFNQACDVSDLKIDYYFRENNRNYGVTWNYDVGHDSEYPLCSHPKFDFNREEDKDGNVSYRFSKQNQGHQDQKHHWSEVNKWHWHEHRSDAMVTVSWVAGENKITVKGTTNYTYKDYFSPNEDLKLKDGQLSYIYKINWKFDIVLATIENGTMKFQLNKPDGPDGLANLEVTYIEEDKDLDNTPPGQAENIKERFKSKLKGCLDQLTKDLEENLQTTAHFTYPGGGSLVFLNPVMNKPGNLLADIHFKPITAKDTYVEVTDVIVIDLPTVPKVTPAPTPVSTGKTALSPKLTWSMKSVSYPKKLNAIPAGIKAAKVKLLGINNTDRPIYFARVSVRFTSGKKENNMFSADGINDRWIPGTQPAEPPKEKKLSQGKPSPTSTPSEESQSKPSTGESGSEAKIPSKGTTGERRESGVTPAPKPPFPATNVVTATASSKETIIQASVPVYPGANTIDGTTIWIAAILPTDIDDGGYFKVPPGESISLDFIIDINKPRKHPVFVEEMWKDEQDPIEYPPEGFTGNDKWSLEVNVERI